MLIREVISMCALASSLASLLAASCMVSPNSINPVCFATAHIRTREQSKQANMHETSPERKEKITCRKSPKTSSWFNVSSA